MSHGFPHRRHGPRIHQVEEKRLQYYSRILQIIPIHVYARNRAYESARAHKDHPVPLPPATDNSKALVLSKILFPMFSQIDQGQHDAEGKE